MIIWFTSDSHFGHHNIIGYQGRPFSCVEEMDECMIDRWNEIVKPEDHIYHLGDVTMSRGGRQQQEPFVRLIKRLSGHKRLILGNHDHFPIQAYLEAGFEKIHGPGQWFGNKILFSHYPIHPNSMGSAKANVHGHIHASEGPKPLDWLDSKQVPHTSYYINVCVEATHYRPVSMEEIQQTVEKKGKPVWL